MQAMRESRSRERVGKWGIPLKFQVYETKRSFLWYLNPSHALISIWPFNPTLIEIKRAQLTIPFSSFCVNEQNVLKDSKRFYMMLPWLYNKTIPRMLKQMECVLYWIITVHFVQFGKYWVWRNLIYYTYTLLGEDEGYFAIRNNLKYVCNSSLSFPS